MLGLNTAGRMVFALGIAAIGAVSLTFSEYVSGLQPLPADLPGHLAIAIATGSALLLCGIGMLFARTARVAALSVAALMLLGCLLIHLPILLANIRIGYSWVRLFETLALGGAGLVLAGMMGAKKHFANDSGEKLIRVGRIFFGISLPVFATTHFIYPEIVASLIPAWIPAKLFLAYFTGAAHLFAGLAILSNIKARLAAALAGAMYGSWALILHVPRVAADIGNQGEATSLFVAVALCGAAWVIAGSVSKAAAVTAAGSIAQRA